MSRTKSDVRGFPRPTGELRAVITNAARYNNGSAYIFKDGVLIIEKAEAKVRGRTLTTSMEVYHAYYCAIPFTIDDYTLSDQEYNPDNYIWESGRIVLTDPSVLLNGVERVTVAFGDESYLIKELKASHGVNLSRDAVILQTQGGMTFKTDILKLDGRALHSTMVIQRNEDQSLWKTLEYWRHRVTVITHSVS